MLLFTNTYYSVLLHTIGPKPASRYSRVSRSSPICWASSQCTKIWFGTWARGFGFRV